MAPNTQLSLFPESETTPNDLVAVAIKGSLDTSGVARLVRTSGSYIDELLTDTNGEQTVNFLKSLDFKDVTALATECAWNDGAPSSCRYYQAAIPDAYHGYLNAVTLDALAIQTVGMSINEWDQLLPGEEREYIGKRLNGLLADIGPMVMGDHEPMFELDYFPHSVNHVTVITGSDQGRTVVYTWFPGDPAGKPARLGEITIHGSITPKL